MILRFKTRLISCQNVSTLLRQNSVRNLSILLGYKLMKLSTTISIRLLIARESEYQYQRRSVGPSCASMGQNHAVSCKRGKCFNLDWIVPGRQSRKFLTITMSMTMYLLPR